MFSSKHALKFFAPLSKQLDEHVDEQEDEEEDEEEDEQGREHSSVGSSQEVDDFDHHATFGSFAESVEQGCQICCRVWMGIFPDVDVRSVSSTTRCSNSNSSTPATRYRFGVTGRKSFYFSVETNQPDLDTIRVGFEVRRSQHNASPSRSPVLNYAATRTSHTGYTGTWSLASYWLQSCLDNHTTCLHMPGGLRWYPTRLVDLGSQYDDSIRLVVTSEQSLQDPYATLSYCWGSRPFFKLKQDNFELCRSEIPQVDIPQVFRDAVFATRKLGLRYIWIDALCIVQDSVEDWRQEAATMAKVYRHALCTIAATASTEAADGLFYERLNVLIPECVVSYAARGAEITELTVLPFDWYARSMRDAPLHRRAWVLQERICSPRLLHFDKEQIFWECHESNACETFPDGIPADVIYFPPKTLRKQAMTEDSKSGDTNHLELRFWWDTVVQSYNKCALTEPGDKFVAISAIVKDLETPLEDTYVAGLWEKFLIVELLWEARSLGKRPVTYRAPTWSWASIDGLVVTDSSLRQQDARKDLTSVVEYHMTPVSADHTGQLSNAWIRLHGPLLTYRTISSIDGGKQYRFSYVYKDIEFDVSSMESLVVLLAFRSRVYGNVHGLLLDSVPERGVGYYIRLGHIRLYEEGGLEPLQACMESTGIDPDDPKTWPLELYEPGDNRTLVLV